MNDAFPDFEAQAASIHRATLCLDSHIDIPWPHTPGPFGDSTRHVDFPKMLAGGMNAGCFVAYIPQGPLTIQAGNDAAARCFTMLEAINATGTGQNGILTRLCPTPDAIEAAFAEGALAVVPAIENGHAIGDDLARIEKFRALGVVYITMSHNGHNLLADSANPRRDLGDNETLHGGLSDLGRAAVREMNRCGIMVDVSHLAKSAMMQAVELSSVPVVASHSCAAALCSHVRNLDDAQLEAIRDCGGVAQVTAMPPFIKFKGGVNSVTVADMVDHIDHIVQRIGIKHCGISSDFDGGGALADWRHAGDTFNVTAELVRRGYNAEEIGLLWGGNFLRVMRVVQAGTAI